MLLLMNHLLTPCSSHTNLLPLEMQSYSWLIDTDTRLKNGSWYTQYKHQWYQLVWSIYIVDTEDLALEYDYWFTH